MTIRKGEPWGRPGVVPPDVVRADTDSAVASLHGRQVQVNGGNLWRCLGRPGPKAVGERCTVLPVDAIRCVVSRPGDGSSVDEETVVTAVAEVVVGSWFAPGGLTVVTNAGVQGELNITPRAHPNDGEFDILRVERSTSPRQRIVARRRARTGTHVPHPTISVHRSTLVEIPRAGRQRLVIDGVPFGHWTSVRLEIMPDHVDVLV